MGNTLPTSAEEYKRLPSSDEEDEDQQSTFTCEICCEPRSIIDEILTNSSIPCSHPFCSNCVRNYVRAKLDDNEGNIPCPALTCSQNLDPIACADVVGPSLLVRWCDVLCEAAVLGLDKCYCPYTDCNEVIVNECGDSLTKSSCPKCKRLFCFECKSYWHMGIRCSESRVMFRDRDDVAFGRLVEEKQWMRCQRCWHFVERVSGCRRIRCRCGITFCYNCGKAVKDDDMCPCLESPLNVSIAFRIVLLLVGIAYLFAFLQFFHLI